MSGIEEGSATPPSVKELAHEVRELVNERRTHASLRGGRFNELCSCLDAIEDTQLGIEWYSPDSQERDPGALYFLLYGILQLFYVQQDALRGLAGSARLPYQRGALLTEVRRLRNETAGHPTKTNYDDASHFIVRMTITPRQYDLLKLRPDDSSSFRSISIPDLIQKQDQGVREDLLKIRDHLKEQDRQHRARHMEKKLAALFPPDTGYLFSKLFDAADRDGGHQLAKLHVDLILKTLAEFKAALAERGDLEAYGMRDALDEVEWPLQRLQEYFAGGESVLVDRSAQIFAWFCRRKVEDLQEMAAEIDRDYAEGT